MSTNLARVIFGSGFGLNVGFPGYPSGREYLGLMGRQSTQMSFPISFDAHTTDPHGYPSVYLVKHLLGTAEKGLALTFTDAGRRLKIDAQPEPLPPQGRDRWGFEAEFDDYGMRNDGDGPGYRSWLFRGQIPESPFEDGALNSDPTAPQNNMLMVFLQEVSGGILSKLGFKVGAGLFASPGFIEALRAGLLEEVSAEGSLWKLNETETDGEQTLHLEYSSPDGETPDSAHPRAAFVGNTGTIKLSSKDGIYQLIAELNTGNGKHDFLPEALLKFMGAYGAFILSGSAPR